MNQQYVYLVRSGKYYKIGIANNPKERINQIQVGNPHKIIFVSCYFMKDAGIVEKALHSAFSEKQVNREWFALDEKEVEKFNNICETLGGQRQEYETENKNQLPSVIDTIREDAIPVLTSILITLFLLFFK